MWKIKKTKHKQGKNIYYQYHRQRINFSNIKEFPQKNNKQDLQPPRKKGKLYDQIVPRKWHTNTSMIPRPGLIQVRHADTELFIYGYALYYF